MGLLLRLVCRCEGKGKGQMQKHAFRLPFLAYVFLFLLLSFSVPGSLQILLLLMVTRFSFFLQRWKIFSVNCMCAMIPANRYTSNWNVFQFLVFVYDIFDRAKCRNCALLQVKSWEQQVILFTRVIMINVLSCLVYLLRGTLKLPKDW